MTELERQAWIKTGVWRCSKCNHATPVARSWLEYSLEKHWEGEDITSMLSSNPRNEYLCKECDTRAVHSLEMESSHD